MDNVRLGTINNDRIICNNRINQRMILTLSEYTKKQDLIQTESQAKVKLAYNFYDTQQYKKDEYGTKFGKRKFEKSDNMAGKKRKRNDSNVS
jgi:hypothetical protein